MAQRMSERTDQSQHKDIPLGFSFQWAGKSGLKNFQHVFWPGMAKVSDSRGGSSYKDLGLSLGGSSYKEINPVPEAARNRI